MANGEDAGVGGGPDAGLADAAAAADAGLGSQPAADSVGACTDAGEVLPGGAPYPPIVTPIINITNRVVLVKKPYMSSPKRKPVDLATDQPFDGTGTFTSSSGAIRFFSKDKDGVEIFSGHVFQGDELSPSVTLYAEGASPSAKVDDVILTLSLTRGPKKDVNKPVTAKITSVEVTLDICKSRAKADENPAPLSTDEKINVGRLIHAQDAGMHRRRAMLIVQKAKPNDFTGTLVLTPKDGHVKMYNAADDPPAAGQAPLATAKKANGSIPATGAKYWAEGVTVSGAPRDTGFKLGVEGVDPEGDLVAVTVFKIDKIEAKLRATPCKRDGSRADVMPVKSSTADSKTFDATAITVVRECGDLKLTATTTPADIPVSWDVERASDDKGLAGLPTHSDDGGSKKRLLKADGTGSFHVHAFMDANGSGKRDFDEDGLILNVNMVKIEVLPGVANNRITKRNSHFHSVADPTMLYVQSGSDLAIPQGINGAYGIAQMTLRPLTMSVKVKLTGGGDKQLRGLDHVFLGYIHNLRGESFTGTYADGRTEKAVFDSVPPPPDSITGPGAVALLGFPIRDTRSLSQNGTGPFIINSTDSDPADKKDLPSGGQQRVVKFMDKPSTFTHKTHAVTASALASIAGSHDFAAFLSAFSSDFDENYTVIAKGDWSITFGTFSAVTGWKKTGAITTAAKAMDTAGMPATGESAGMERCTPNATAHWKLDAR